MFPTRFQFISFFLFHLVLVGERAPYFFRCHGHMVTLSFSSFLFSHLTSSLPCLAFSIPCFLSWLPSLLIRLSPSSSLFTPPNPGYTHIPTFSSCFSSFSHMANTASSSSTNTTRGAHRSRASSAFIFPDTADYHSSTTSSPRLQLLSGTGSPCGDGKSLLSVFLS